MGMQIPIFRRRKGPFSRKRYWISNILWWIYTIAWLSFQGMVWYFWNISLWLKITISFFLILCAPSIGDLLTPYDVYKKEWEEQHENKGSKEA